MNPRTIFLWRLRDEADQALLVQEWQAAKRYLKRPSTIVLILIVGLLDALNCLGTGGFIKAAFWATLIVTSLTERLAKDKTESLFATPITAQMLFPAILVRPIAFYAFASLAAIPFTPLFAFLNTEFQLSNFWSFGMRNQTQQMQDIRAFTEKMSWWTYPVGVIYACAAAFSQYVCGLAMSAFLARRSLSKPGFLGAFLRGLFVFLAVETGSLVAVMLLSFVAMAFLPSIYILSPKMFFSPAGQMPEMNMSSLYTMSMVGFLWPALSLLAYLVIYKEDIRKLQSSQTLERLRESQGF